MGGAGDGVGVMAAVTIGLAAGVGVAGGISVGAGVETGGCVGTPAGVMVMEADALFAISASCFLFPDAQPLAHSEITARTRNITCRLRIIFVIKGCPEKIFISRKVAKAQRFSLPLPFAALHPFDCVQDMLCVKLCGLRSY
ncbi:MAG: hypothetical protein DSY55_04195 [Clostridia bacterium]|nr:MAG: hypothetical protein DSY55_04195 [Clostridia bacterium]